MIIKIKTITTYFLWIIIFPTFTLLCLPITFLPKQTRLHNRFYFFLTTIWNKLLLRSAFVKEEIKGKRNLPKYPNSPSIIIANHSSALDIFLLESLIGTYPHTWISKDSFGKIPFFGTIIKRMHVLVKRESPKQAAQALVKTYQQAKLGPKHIIIFPEGTRHDDGKIHALMPGFAILAKKLNWPVIPITIKGVHKIFPKKSLLIDSNASNVKLVVGKPIFFAQKETSSDFIKKAEDWFRKTLEN